MNLFTPAETAANYAAAGVVKTQYAAVKLLLLGMAAGQCVVSGAEQMYYDFIGEHHLRPVFNTSPTADGFEALLRNLILNPAQLRHAAAIGREFVARHNDSDLVARRCLDFYNSL